MIRIATALCFAWLLAAPAAAQDERAFLDVSLNNVAHGDALVIIRPPDILVEVKTLAGAGMAQIGGRREVVDGSEFVSLASLSPAVTFTLDEPSLRLSINADPSLLGATVQDLRDGQPADLSYSRSDSGFVNYSLNASTSGRDYEAFTESAYSHRGALFYNTASWTPRGVVRGLTNVTFDQRRQLRRWVAGDSFVGGDALGGDALITGVSVAREFSLAPYFVRYPSMSLSTPVSTPSVVDVYVNGRLVRSEAVQPGRLDLHNLPLTSGSNNTRVVVRDPFGSTREVTSGYYLTTSVLARGIHDYRYSAGSQRRSFGSRNWDYGTPTLLARHRVGISNSLTLGGRVEAERGIVSGGPSANIRLPFGEIELVGGVSRHGRRRGLAGQTSYVYAGRAFSVGTSLRHAANAYSTIGALSATTQPRRQVDFFAAFPMRSGSSLAAQYSHRQSLASGTQKRASLLGTVRLGRMMDMVTTASHVTDVQRRGYEVSTGVTVNLAARLVASVSGVRDEQGNHAVLDVQRPLPVGTGVGYQVHSESGVQDSTSGVLQYQGQYGRYELRSEKVGASQQSVVSAAGALVGIGGHVFATRPVRNSFALIKVPEVGGVRAFSSNQEIGRTSRRGDLLVTDLLPYYGNRLSIADSDIPIDYVVSEADVTLAPPYRGGAVVLFPVRLVQRSTGTIVVVKQGVETTPVYGQLVVHAGPEEHESPIGTDGEFYLEGVAAGSHAAVVTWDGGSCSFTIVVPAVKTPVVTLGRLRCDDTSAP